MISSLLKKLKDYEIGVDSQKFQFYYGHDLKLIIDFETTGLDLGSDFPIQIAVVQTDHHMKVLQHYTRYITLPESIKRLRSNVSYMTGIDIETIESQGQSLDTIQSEI